MKYVFSRYSHTGDEGLVLDLDAILSIGAAITFDLDGHQYGADLKILYPNGDEMTLEFEDVAGYYEDHGVENILTLERTAIGRGRYRMNKEFWRAYEALISTDDSEEEDERLPTDPG